MIVETIQPLSQMAAARDLCSAANLAPVRRLVRLEGGKNNRVFRVDCEDQSQFVMKLYHVDPRDSRDRLGAEWSFLSYVWDRNVKTVPQPVSASPDTASALYAFVPGIKVEASAIDQVLVDQAAEFILAINGVPRLPMDLAPGSESCFSINDHIATVERRVARLGNLDLTAPHKDAAAEFVGDHLLPAWQGLKSRLLALQGEGDRLPAPEVCISPSDFGFHNALVNESGKATFIDFEYAGHDDPAKLVCDFFCCPEIQVPISFRQTFIEQLAEGLALGAEFRRRCDVLIDAYRVKWTCIILNDFLPLGAARREFAAGVDREVRCRDQLEKAKTKLAEIGLR